MRIANVALLASMMIGLPALTTCAADPEAPEKRQAATEPSSQRGGGFPGITVDAKAKQIRVECEALRVANPLEFFLCVSGSVEHESVLRSTARPSHLHAAMLMLGLAPGEPVRYSESLDKWLPPHGPPLQITAIFEKDGKTVTLPAYRLLREVRTKKEMPPMTWIFAGSKLIEDTYAADRTGYLISVVNFELTVIDIPRLASNANETLEWETNLELMPKEAGTAVTLLIEPAGKVEAANGAAAPAAPVDQTLVTIDAEGRIQVDGRPAASAAEVVERVKAGDGAKSVRVAVVNPIEENVAAREVINALSAARVSFIAIPQAGATPPNAPPTTRPTDISAEIRADEAHIRRLRAKWEQSVAPHGAGLREAAKTHYDVIAQLRREQQRLIDEADKIQRLIDELEKQYQDMTTPGPQ
ncbi:MAG: YdjY domain-containing protein [Tepidisphaeraceae bacterium]